MSPRRVLLFLCAVSAMAAVTRPAGAESLYSLRGDGEAVPTMTAELRAAGGARAATTVAGIGGNPASLSFAQRTTFYGTYELEWVRSRESAHPEAGTRKDLAGILPNLALVFPLPQDFRLGTGLLVSRRRKGTVDRPETVTDGAGGTLEYRQVYQASGSLIRIPFLLGRDLGPVQLGAGMDISLLGSKITWRNDFSDADETLGFVDSEDLDQTSLRGVAWRAGARIPLGSRLAVGAWTCLPGTFNGDRRRESEQAGSASERVDDLSAESASVVAIGLEGRPAPQVKVAMDWVRENWESADPLGTELPVNVDRIAVGLEWSPRAERGGLRMPVRAGFRTENLHVRDGLGQEVREQVLTLGSGFGIAGGRGDIDWYLELGRRGEEGVTEFSERMVRFGLTVTGWEEWTRRRKLPEEDDW